MAEPQARRARFHQPGGDGRRHRLGGERRPGDQRRGIQCLTQRAAFVQRGDEQDGLGLLGQFAPPG